MRREQVLDNLIVRHVAGSRAYGTNGPNSDEDFRGIFCAPREVVLTPFHGNHQTFEDGQEEDTVYYELRHFMKLAAAMNPNVIETLWVRQDDVVRTSVMYDMLRFNRDAFMSKRIATTTVGYAEGEFQRVKNKLERTGEMSHKNAMHVVRLMRMGVEVLQTGRLEVYRSDAPELLDIKNGAWTIEQLQAYAEEMKERVNMLEVTSDLPEHPNLDVLTELTMRVYDYAWQQS